MTVATLAGRVELHRGQSYKSALLDRPGPHLLGLGTIARNGGFNGGSLRTYGGDSPDRILLRPGDLYLSLKDVTHKAELLGAVSRVPESVPLGRLTQDTVRLEVVGDDIDSNYLYWLLKSPDYRAYCRARGTGTTNLDLSRSDFLAFEFRLPPLPEQQAIAEVLGALDDKIAANTALAATADLYASTLLLGSLGTDRVRLDSIARITMGSSPKGESLNELGEGVPFYQGVRDFSFRSPARRVFTTSLIRSADSGDILVSVRAPVGEVNIADEPICIGRGVAAVRSTTGTQATLFHQLKGERGAWAPYEAEGTVFGSINRGQLHGIELRLVRPERAGLVEHELATLESSIAATLAEDRTLAAIRDALLPRLMSGELRVADIEHDIESMDLDSSVPTDKEPS